MNFIRISPYWNVNLQELDESKDEGLIRISPYWNVNLLHPALFSCFLLIYSNITILECKLLSAVLNAKLCYHSNITILECKSYIKV